MQSVCKTALAMPMYNKGAMMKRNNWRRKNVIKSAFSEIIAEIRNDNSHPFIKIYVVFAAIAMLMAIPIGSCNDEKSRNEIIEQESYAKGYNQGFEEGCAAGEENIREAIRNKLSNEDPDFVEYILNY